MEDSGRLGGFFDDGVGLLGVLGPGAVVEADVGGADDGEAEGDDGSGDAGAAGGRDRLLRIDTFGCEDFAEFFGGLAVESSNRMLGRAVA